MSDPTPFIPAAPIFFHDLNVTDITDISGITRAQRATMLPNFDPAECASVLSSQRRSQCVPAYVSAWQERMRGSLPADLATRRHASCAVVGSSTSILHTPRGHLIDEAQVVIRVNAAPTHGFEAFTGARTTIRIWGSPGQVVLGRDAKGARLTQEVWGESPTLSTEERGQLSIVACPSVHWMGRCWNDLHNATITAYPRFAPQWKQRLRDRIRQATGRAVVGMHPTTGAVAIGYALQACDRVALFGFANCTDKARSGSRYYSPHYGRVTYFRHMNFFHDPTMEWLWIRDLARQGAVVDVEGNCTSVK